MTVTTVQEGLTPEQAAKRIRTSTRWVYDRIHEWEEGDPLGLPARNVTRKKGKGARYRINPDVLDGWLKSWLEAA